MSILLVIDMQPRFSTSCRNWLLENVSREIREAMAKRDGIVFLEYTRQMGACGVKLHERTHRSLIDLVVNSKYEDAMVVHKEGDDGSEEVVRAIKNWQKLDRICVVGVNKTACVFSTVRGLSKLLPDTEIVVVGDACNDREKGNEGGPSNINHEYLLSTGNNVRVLRVSK